MRHLLSALFLIAATVATGCASTSGDGAYSSRYDFGRVDKVAVLSVEGALRSEAARAQITDLFNLSLLKKDFTPVERQRIRQILEEQDFQATDTTSALDAAEIGRILNVGAVIIVNVPEYRDNMSMSARMVAVDSGSIVWTASGTARTGIYGSTIAGGLLGGIAGAEASGNDAGTIAGAVGGGLAGRALSPQKQKQAARLIAKLTESLPNALAAR